MKNILILLTTIITLYSFKRLESEDKVAWKNSQTLTWQNFKAQADNASKLAALSTCKISTKNNVRDDSDSIEFIIESYFVSNESWVKSSEKNDYLLKHEQGHFDLNEIYARQIRKELTKTKFTLGTLNLVFKDIVKKYFNQLNAVQELYDSETKHSKDKKKQEEWNIKISTQLKELNLYSPSIIVVPY
ncbi:MAG: hypothetical protein A3F72_07945 [Bacteroidetes bacterium RIFCSPLOWO2_12_FULL_35_15]|nr:MAG: hypothetical protein A3F72_07945 [Bacteroidetes bacterium RIFCSPLOWO2_12_FULL_35_15]